MAALMLAARSLGGTNDGCFVSSSIFSYREPAMTICFESVFNMCDRVRSGIRKAQADSGPCAASS